MMDFGKFYELKTRRLHFRMMDESDLYDYHEFAGDSDTIFYTAWVLTKTIDDAKKKLLERIENAEKGTFHIAAIVDNESNKMIGNIMFFDLSEKDKRVEVGYILNKKYWGKGFITEALKEFVNYIFITLNLNKISAQIVDGNIGSKNVLEKNGFKLEGTLRENYLYENGFKDLLVYSILKSEYQEFC
ncbi:GNAT family protein [Mycoplasmatota bacterium WC44]